MLHDLHVELRALALVHLLEEMQVSGLFAGHDLEDARAAAPGGMRRQEAVLPGLRRVSPQDEIGLELRGPRALELPNLVQGPRGLGLALDAV